MLRDTVVRPASEEEVSHTVGRGQRLVQLGTGRRGGEGRGGKGGEGRGRKERGGIWIWDTQAHTGYQPV